MSIRAFTQSNNLSNVVSGQLPAGHSRSSVEMTQRGFTLIEVLIAVAILAIALLAVTRVTSVAIRNSEYLQQKTVAHWVTMDTLANVEVGLTPAPAAGGQQTGTTNILGKNYPWVITASNLNDQPMVRIEVKVYAADKKQLLDSAYDYFPPVESKKT